MPKPSSARPRGDRVPKDSDEHRQLVIAAARMSAQDMRQSRIAKVLGRSQAEISRLLDQAREKGFYNPTPQIYRDQIDPDRVVDPQRLCNEQLGAYAVGSRDQDGVPIAPKEREQPSKASNPSHYARGLCRTGQRLDALDQCFSSIDIDSGIAV